MLARLLVLLVATANALVVTPSVAHAAAAVRTTAPAMFFGKKADAQGKLAERQKKANELPKGSVEITFPQKGNKKIIAKQGEPLGKVVQRAGLKVKFDCKNGRCATCQVRLNGRATAKICQGATVPGGAVRKLSITLDNP